MTCRRNSALPVPVGFPPAFAGQWIPAVYKKLCGKSNFKKTKRLIQTWTCSN